MRDHQSGQAGRTGRRDITRRLIGILGVSTIAVTAVEAATLSPPSRIEAVTLYPDAAMVTRQIELDLAAGSHEIVLADLPLTIDPASLRVEGSGEARLLIGGIDFRLRPATPGHQSKLAQELRDLKLARDRVLDQIDAAEGRKAMIRRLADGAGDAKDARPLDLATFMQAVELVGKGLQQVNADIRGLSIEQARLDEEIARLEGARQQPRAQAPQREAVIALEAAAAGKARLTIRYAARGASWRPIYDARLETRGDKPALALTRRALIRQKTGEDWLGARLTLSTLRVQRGTMAPTLTGEVIRFYQKPEPRPLAGRSTSREQAAAAMMADAEASSRQKVMAAPAPMPAQVAEEAGAASLNTAFQTEFAIAGLQSLPSDSEEKSVRLGEETMEPSLRHKAAPILDPTAYLDARLRWSGAAPLLAGEVLLNRDGAFIGRGRLGDTAPGEEMALGFGADERVKLTRVPIGREAREPGLFGSTRSDEFRFRIDVKNLHAFPVMVDIHDRIPVSEDSQISVERLPEMTKPDRENPDDRRGVVVWEATLKPQAAMSVISAYRLRWPASREIRRQPLPH